ERRLVPARQPQGWPARSQIAGRGGGQRPAAAGRAADQQAGRRRDQQSPDRPRLLRQHEPGLAGDGPPLRFFPPRGGGGAGGCDFHSGQLVLLDEERVDRRSEMIALAIDARRQHFPGETPYDYQPLANARFRWDEAAKATIYGYSKRDLII